jgi:hypothetical protein
MNVPGVRRGTRPGIERKWADRSPTSAGLTMIRASKAAAAGRAAPLVVLGVLGCLIQDGSGIGAAAQELSRSPRGGALAKGGGYQFEIFVFPTGVRLFPTSATGAAVDVSKLTGTATFYHPNSPDPWFSRPFPAATTSGATSLDLPINLATVPPTGARIEFELAGLPGTTEASVTFAVPVEFVRTSEGGGTRPNAPQGSTTTEPSYVYGVGASGVGYYSYTGPQTAPTRASTTPTFSAPMPARTSSTSRSGSSSTRGYRDWSTGRDSMRLAKPWLNAN